MKRQVAIVGPTPEFLRWSIRQSCPMRADIALDSVDQTEKRLGAIRTAGQAIQRNQVFEGIAVRDVDRKPKGFRIAEVFDLYGGFQVVRNCCGDCPANVVDPSSSKGDQTDGDLPHGDLANCHGWVKRTSDCSDPGELIEQSLTSSQRKAASQWFVHTNPLWYGFWVEGVLQGSRLEFLANLFQGLDRDVMCEDTRRFVRVLGSCAKKKQTLNLELVPPGNSDGLRWTIMPHCDRCKAVFDSTIRVCPVCNKSGKGHPLIRRKVRGMRPWVDLATVLGAENVNAFLERHHLIEQSG